MGHYPILDHAPKGRNEGEAWQLWIRRHDEYESECRGCGASVRCRDAIGFDRARSGGPMGGRHRRLVRPRPRVRARARRAAAIPCSRSRAATSACAPSPTRSELERRPARAARRRSLDHRRSRRAARASGIARGRAARQQRRRRDLRSLRRDPVERERELVRLNVEAIVALTHGLLPALLARGQGGVINVASQMAFQPMPYFAAYAASKAFVLSFSEALAEELRGTGVRVTAVAPGFVSDRVHRGRRQPRARAPLPAPRATARGRVRPPRPRARSHGQGRRRPLRLPHLRRPLRAPGSSATDDGTGDATDVHPADGPVHGSGMTVDPDWGGLQKRIAGEAGAPPDRLPTMLCASRSSHSFTACARRPSCCARALTMSPRRWGWPSDRDCRRRRAAAGTASRDDLRVKES